MKVSNTQAAAIGFVVYAGAKEILNLASKVYKLFQGSMSKEEIKNLRNELAITFAGTLITGSVAFWVIPVLKQATYRDELLYLVGHNVEKITAAIDYLNTRRDLF